MEDEDGEGLEAGLENMSLEHGRLEDDSRSPEGDPSRFYNLQVGHPVEFFFFLAVLRTYVLCCLGTPGSWIRIH